MPWSWRTRWICPRFITRVWDAIIRMPMIGFTRSYWRASPDTSRALKPLGIGYAFYLRKRQRDPNDILYRLVKGAAAVITDDYPTFVARRHNASAPYKIDIPYFAVDASCIVPMNRMEKREWAAYTIRPKITKMLPDYLHPVKLPPVRKRWTGKQWRWHTSVTDEAIPGLVASCEIDHSVKPVTTFRGGSREANRTLRRFLNKNLRRYARDRNDPAEHATSNLSPYLHFGHISSLEVAIRAKEHAHKHKLVADEFLEELIVRRELAFNFTRFTPNYDSARQPSRLGLAYAQEACQGRARSPIHCRANGSGRNVRRVMERNAEGAFAARQNPWLLSDVLGQEDHRVVSHTRGSAFAHAAPAR